MSLLSLPDELLWKCLPTCPFEKRDGVRKTCRRLGDLILQHQPVHLQIRDEDEHQEWHLTLRRVLALCPGVRCVLLGKHEDPLTDEELLECFLGNMPAPATGAIWPKNPTAFLTHLTLQDITTSQLVPHVITATCPKLKRLKLRWADIRTATDSATGTMQPLAPAGAAATRSSTTTTTTTTATARGPAAGRPLRMGAGAGTHPAATHTPPVCSLERLSLHMGNITLNADTITAQLRALGKLRHLDWCISHGSQAHWDSVMQAVGQQLTQLRMASWKTERQGPSMQWQVPKDLSPLLALTDLRIAAVVTDTIMQQLLQQLPHVQQLHVDSFRITEDYSSRQCSWQGVYMRHVIIATLPLLPLQSVQWLGYDMWYHGHSGITLPAPADESGAAVAAAIAVTQAAIAVAAACGGMKATCKELDHDRDEPHWASVQISLPQHYTEDQLLACLWWASSSQHQGIISMTRNLMMYHQIHPIDWTYRWLCLPPWASIYRN